MGAILKMCAGMVGNAGQRQMVDVVMQQVRNLLRGQCHSELASDMIVTGRASPAITTSRGPERAVVPNGPRKKWSRECRRAYASSWFWQWFRLSPLAPKKSKLLNRSFRKLPTPASTDHDPARVWRYLPTRPAPTSGMMRTGAVAGTPPNSCIPGQTLWAFLPHWPIPPADFQERRQDRC